MSMSFKRTLTVVHEQATKGSKRHVGHGRLIEQTHKKLDPYTKAIVREAKTQGWDLTPISEGPIRVSLQFYMQRPQSHYRTGKFADELKANAPLWHSMRAKDVDKMSRAVLDALTQAGVWGDDGQVCWLTAQKFYGEQAKTVITIQPVFT